MMSIINRLLMIRNCSFFEGRHADEKVIEEARVKLIENQEEIDIKDQQLAAAKAEIAEYRNLLNVIAVITDNVGILRKIDEALAKHKGE